MKQSQIIAILMFHVKQKNNKTNVSRETLGYNLDFWTKKKYNIAIESELLWKIKQKLYL